MRAGRRLSLRIYSGDADRDGGGAFGGSAPRNSD